MSGVAKITSMVVSMIMIGTVGIVGLSYLVNTTYLTANNITGTNATIFGVIAIMGIVSFFVHMAPRGK